MNYYNQDHDRDILKMLLKYGADVNLKDSKGRTALHYACEWQKMDVIEVLLKAGTQTNIVDNGGFTELQIACRSYKDADLKVKCLLESGSFPAHVIIEAYEELAWSFLRKNDAFYSKLDKVVDNLTKAMEMREHNLPKTVFDRLDCYGISKEWETIQQQMMDKSSREPLLLQAILSRNCKKRQPSHIPLKEDIEHYGLYKTFSPLCR